MTEEYIGTDGQIVATVSSTIPGFTFIPDGFTPDDARPSDEKKAKAHRAKIEQANSKIKLRGLADDVDDLKAQIKDLKKQLKALAPASTNPTDPA